MNDFDDISLFEDLRTDSTQYLEDHKRENYSSAPLAFLDDGNYWLRFYPRLIEVDGKKRLKVVRSVLSHNFRSVDSIKKRFICEGPSCRICRETAKLSSAKIRDAFRYTKSEDGVVCVHIYKFDGKPSEYIKIGEPMFLVVRQKVVESISNWIAGLDPEDLREVLNPNVKAPIVKLSYKGGTGGNASLGFDIKKAELPKLPEDFASFYDVYCRETDIASDEDLNSIRTFVGEILSRKTNIFNPDEDDAPVVAAKTAAKQQVAAILDDSDDDVPWKDDSKAGSQTETCPSEAEGLSFGSHPTDQHMSCIICPIEEACLKASGQ